MSVDNSIHPRTVTQLEALDGIKWQRYGPGMLASWVADMDLAPPAVATEAVRGLVDKGDLGYASVWAEEIPLAFSRWQQTRHGWSPDPEQVTLFNSVLHAIDALLWLTTEPGDGVVLFTPIYPPFRAALAESDRRLIDVPLDPDGWALDPERFRSAIDETTRVILFCNPHNPTGRTFTREECRIVAEVAAEFDLLVLSDEVWADLVHPEGNHVPLAVLDGLEPGLADDLAQRLVTLSSASKTFNLAGLKSAVGHVSSPRVRAALAELPSHFLGGLNNPGGAATVACWNQGEQWYQNLLVHLRARRDQLARRLTEDLGEVGFQLPEATYLAWLDFSAYNLDEEPGPWLATHAKVAFNEGLDFGPNGSGFVRMNLATSEEIVDAVVDALASALVGRSS